jgi:beta-catenin-like protein 1
VSRAITSPRSREAVTNEFREKLLAKTRAIKVLSYAMQSVEGSANCEKFVEVLGLKTFFPAFMGKVSCFSS